MTRDDIFTLFATRQRHWNAHNAAGLASSHSTDCVVESPIFGVIKGREGIEESYARLFTVFSEWVFDAEQAVVDGDRAVQPFQVHAVHGSELFGVPATGKRLEIRGALMFEFKDGKISRERRLYDFTGMLVQLGVLKAKPRG